MSVIVVLVTIFAADYAVVGDTSAGGASGGYGCQSLVLVVENRRDKNWLGEYHRGRSMNGC